MTQGKYVPHKGDFDLTGWTLDTFEKMSDEMIEEHWKPLLLKALSELLELASKERVIAHFPAFWARNPDPEDGFGNPPVKDPLVIHICLPIAEEQFAGPIWAINLRDMVKDDIEGLELGHGGPIGEEDKVYFRDLRESLMTLVAEIDAALARPKPARKKK